MKDLHTFWEHVLLYFVSSFFLFLMSSFISVFHQGTGFFFKFIFDNGIVLLAVWIILSLINLSYKLMLPELKLGSFRLRSPWKEFQSAFFMRYFSLWLFWKLFWMIGIIIGKWSLLCKSSSTNQSIYSYVILERQGWGLCNCGRHRRYS